MDLYLNSIKLHKKQIIILLGLLFLIIILPLALWLTRQRQEIRKKAEGTREVDVVINPVSGTFYRGDTFDIDVELFDVSFQRNIKVSGAQATINISDKLNINSVKCIDPFHGLSIARINGQTVTFLCAIGVGTIPPLITNSNLRFGSMSLTVRNEATSGGALLNFTSTRVTEAGVEGQAPDVSTRGQNATYTISEITPTISPTLPATPSATLIPTLTLTPTLAATPSASPIPSITPMPRDCSTKVFGDADCDGQTTLDDFKYWLCEFIGGGVCKDINSGRWSDFFRDGKVDMVDFEVYRRNVYK